MMERDIMFHGEKKNQCKIRRLESDEMCAFRECGQESLFGEINIATPTSVT